MADYWRGRMKEDIDKETAAFIGCIKDDERLVEIDIDTNIAHVLMLQKKGIISKKDARKIVQALEKIREEWKKGKLRLREDEIDIHPIIEKKVVDYCGLEIGGKIHTAKSRNDQVVADMRIYTRNEILAISEILLDFISCLIEIAKENKHTVMPGYTHHQHAQVTTFSHYLLCYSEKFLRDVDALLEAYKRVNLSPMGACALTGSIFEIDREYTAKLLGFDGIIENTIDAVSSRDFVIEVLSKLSMIMIGLSRIAQDLIDWCTQEYNFVRIPDKYCDISTAMPHKRNPDVLEVIKSKATLTNNLLGNVTNTLTGLRTGYSRDLQRAKTDLWEAIDSVKASLRILREIMKGLEIQKENILKAIDRSFIGAPDLAEYLIKEKGLPFRRAHYLVGELIKSLEKKGKTLMDLTAVEIEKIGKKTGNEISISQKELQVIDPLNSINRPVEGGPNPKKIEKAIESKMIEMKEKRKKISQMKEKIRQAEKNLRNFE